MDWRQIQRTNYDDLVNPSFIEQLNTEVERIITDWDLKSGRLVLRELESKLDQVKLTGEPKDKYQDILLRLKMVLLSRLRAEEVWSLIRDHAWELVGQDYLVFPDELMENIADNFISLKERDAFKTRLLKALVDNRQQILPGEIEFSPQDRRPFTVGNAVLYYRQYSGNKSPALARAEIFSQDKNFGPLDDESKIRLTKILIIQDYLSASSFSLAGNEDPIELTLPNGAVLETYHGRTSITPAPAKPPVKPLAKPAVASAKVAPLPVVTAAPAAGIGQAELQERYRGDPKEAQAIEDRMEQFKNTAGLGFEPLSQKLNLVISAPRADKLDVVALLYLLAAQGNLGRLLKERDEFYKLTVNYLKQTGQDELLVEAKVNLAAPRLLAEFLAAVLQGNLRLPENEAARIGLHLANLAKQAGETKYAGLAYFDLKQDSFVWNK